MQTSNHQIDPTLLGRYRLFESSDYDETCRRVGTVLQPRRLTPVNQRRNGIAFMNVARLHSVSFGSIRYAASMRVESGEIGEYYLAIICLQGFGEVQIDGRRALIGDLRGVIVGPGAGFGGTFSSDCEQFFVRIEKSAMLTYAGYDRLHFDPTFDLSQPSLAPWLAQLKALISSPETVLLAQRDQCVAVHLERLFISLLLAGQPHRSAASPVTSSPLPRTVRRANAYIREHACEPIVLADIANAAGVPVRTLLDSFQRFVGISPMKRVREIRLDLAREKLSDDCFSVAVGDIALQCGFSNSGRFATAYREKFGETPSDTLRNARAGST